MSSIAKSLKKLGYRPLKSSEGLPRQGYSGLARQIGFNLPADYLAFLSDFPLTGVFDRQVVFIGKEKSPWAADGQEVLEVLYAQSSDKNNDLLKLRGQYSEQIPPHFLAIGQVTGANFVCLDLRDEFLGRVYVWDHEHLDDVRAGFYLTAYSFSEFIELLDAGYEQPSQGAALVKMELSDSLKARIAELKRKNGER